MTDEKKKALLSVLDGMDVSEVISLLIMSGNSYSRRLLKFIKWITKWLPICIMVWHSFAMLDFSQNPREMFIVHSEHWPSYTFIYVLLYVLPLVLILFSRFFWLCWVYRIPFFYYFGLNAIHLTYWSWYTTKDMVMSCMSVIVMTGVFYLYWVIDWFLTRTRIGKRFFF